MAIIYYVLLLPLSFLPLRILYFFSDALYVLLYYITRYRRHVVYENLKKSFPEKTESEIRNIERKFYHHLCDLIVEGLKAFSISEKELNKRIQWKNNELITNYLREGRSVILVTAHYGNWEWASMAFARQSPYKTVGIYLPVNNKFFDRKLHQMRSRLGTELIAVKQTPRFFNSEKEVFSCSFVSDQSPSNRDASYWLQFLNQETAVLQGPEYYARKYNLPVVYGNIQKIRRGYYEVEYSLITDQPLSLNDGEITERFTKATENYIRQRPEFWLWSHRRWKLKKREN